MEAGVQGIEMDLTVHEGQFLAGHPIALRERKIPFVPAQEFLQRLFGLPAASVLIEIKAAVWNQAAQRAEFGEGELAIILSEIEPIARLGVASEWSITFGYQNDEFIRAVRPDQLRGIPGRRIFRPKDATEAALRSMIMVGVRNYHVMTLGHSDQRLRDLLARHRELATRLGVALGSIYDNEPGHDRILWEYFPEADFMTDNAIAFVNT
ncbi:MAG: hypothetical protein A3C90_00300 [Candidatus Magasanikbacteria bacterium RIFCSPHIGHO2_02_FULL_51_14]|uniref:Uncharacterized protein n=1 Tax=Candidatus Magasanikbacteria bacterium RIFCSPHIGHO2_02_FULL_51_14 TaxID=1798683 RepID=A0A1F6MDI3_9BACT|nr:MAG: hypothetical protein A3C90_00300 [Candidatus Magasanikbacteria bacterium RIFCSPHIGHO2_02_FULL_51_14]